MTVPWRLLLCLASAVLYAAAHPPWSIAPLAWLALAPVFVAFQRSRPAAAAALGGVFGVALGAAVAGWLPAMLSGYFGHDPLTAWAGAAAIAAALLGIPFAAFGAWLAWLSERGRARPWVVAAGFCVVEFARANGPIENPWALSAYSQVGFSSLMQSADFAGPFAVGALLGWSNALVAAWFLSGPQRRPVAGAVAALAVLAALVSYGQWRLAQDFGEGEALDVAVVQTVSDEAALLAYPGRDPGEASLEEQLALTRAASEHDPDLVLWPELALEVPLRVDSPASRRLLEASAAMRADLLLGSPDVRAVAYGPKLRNSVFLVRAGRPVDRYDKVRLMPWGEADPLPQLASVLPDVRTRFAAGRGELPLQTRTGPVGMLVCSEGLHPAHARESARQGAELLANPSNDGWFGNPGAVAQAAAAITVRAIENRRYLLRAARDGPSYVVDSHGRVVARGREGTSDVVTATVRPSRVETPFQRYGDVVPGAAAALAFIGTVRPRARRERGEL